MSPEEGKKAVEIARKVVEFWIKKRRKFEPKNYPERFEEKMGVFVSLHSKSGNLKGCIGYIEPEKPLIEGLIEVAVSACQDPRFKPLSVEELNNIVVEVSILTKPEPVEIEDIKKGDGVVLEKGCNKAVFLPQVWKQLPKKEDFLSHLSMKAGLEPDAWKSHNVKAYKFSAEIFKG